MKRKWTEETIAAYVDGSLEPDDTAKIRDIVEEDETARAYADKIERSNALLRQAFAAPMTEEIPHSILAILSTDGVEDTPTKRSNIVAFRRPVFKAAMAMAAGLALAIGIGLALRDGDVPEQIALLGNVPIDAPLHRALEELLSGELSDQGVVPMQTFRDKDGRYCRDFEVFGKSPSGLELSGIACRNADEGWNVEVIAEAPEAVSHDEGFVPASGPGTTALDAKLDELGASPALAPEEERSLIEGRWLKE